MSNGRLSNGSVNPSPPHMAMQNHALSWTDDLPVCHLSGVGFSTNQIYREDGNRREEHEFEDRSFHFKFDNGCFLYGVFDGHNGSKAAHFTAQRMPAELLLDQLKGKTEDEEIKEVLRQAFIAVEKGYFESMDDTLAKKASLQLDIPEGISRFEAFQKYRDIMQELEKLEFEISGGTTATVALIYNRRLYVANVGDTRALLCTLSEDTLTVQQLSYDHTLADPGEQERLKQLGLNIEELRIRKIGNIDCTRCLGDYQVKGGYKEVAGISYAKSEPVIEEPFVHHGIPIDNVCAFLIIMSDGLYQALQDATSTHTVNSDLAAMVANEFSQQSTLHGVAQAVVDKVVRIHHDTYMTGHDRIRHLCQKRDDITLLIRNFGFPLGTAQNAMPLFTSAHAIGQAPQLHLPTNPHLQSPSHPQIPSPRTHGPPSLIIPSPHLSGGGFGDHLEAKTPTNTPSSANLSVENTNQTNASSTDSTQSSEGQRLFASARSYHTPNKLELDAEGKIASYVDFSEFYQAIAQFSEVEKESFDADMSPKSGYETITEESENNSGPEH